MKTIVQNCVSCGDRAYLSCEDGVYCKDCMQLHLLEKVLVQITKLNAPRKNYTRREDVEAVTPKAVKVAEVAPPPLTPEPPADEPAVKTRNGSSGPQFDPGFLAIIRDAKEPFTRASIAVSTGLKKEDVTQRFIRLHKREWIEQPAPGLWRKTKTFAIK